MDAVQILNGQGLDGQRLLQTMAEKGVLDPKSLTIDAGTGVISAGTGKIFDKILTSAGLSREAGISVSSSLNEIKFDPASGRFVIVTRSEVWMTPTQMETFALSQTSNRA